MIHPDDALRSFIIISALSQRSHNLIDLLYAGAVVAQLVPEKRYRI